MSPSPKQQKPRPQERMYSFTVQGWVWGSGGEKNGLSQAQVVAVSNTEAIEEARQLLDPEGALDHWTAATATEISPAEAKGWISWHKAATSPLGRAGAETNQD